MPMDKKGQVKTGVSQRSTVNGQQKKGQVTLFVIIGIVIVVGGILIYQFAPGIKSTFTGESVNAKAYIQLCLEDTLEENINTIMMSGGELNPDHPYMYQGELIDYACFTSKFHELCLLESPMLISKVEVEIKNSIQGKVDSCFDELIIDFENKGYQTNLKKEEIAVELKEQKLLIEINYSLSATKGKTERYEDFNINSNRNLYEILLIGYNIMDWESTLGDADIYTYMYTYPDYRVEKVKRGDGTKIYIISERNSGDTFRFATRSVVATAESYTDLSMAQIQ